MCANFQGINRWSDLFQSVSRASAYVHKACHNSTPQMKTIQYPMIADTTGNICRTFGTLNETDGLPHRATFILDPDGNLKVIEMNDNSFGRNTKELLRKLETAKFVQETRAKSARPAGSREKKRSSRREQVAATKVVILKRHWRSMKKVRLERG